MMDGSDFADDVRGPDPSPRLTPRQRDEALVINIFVGLAAFLAGAGFLFVLQRLGDQ